MANLVELGSLNIAAGYCSIEVSDGEHSESIVIDAEGRAYWRRGDQEREVLLEEPVRLFVQTERERLWALKSVSDFAPAQHSIPWWSWEIVVRVGDESRTFRGNAYDEWAVRQPADVFVDWMRSFIDQQIDASLS